MLIHQSRSHSLVKLFLILVGFIFLVSCSATKEISSEGFNPDLYYNPYSVEDIIQKELAKAGLRTKTKQPKNENFTFAKMKQSVVSISTIRKVEHPITRQPKQTRDEILLELYIDQNGNVQHIETLKSTNPTLASNAAQAFYDATFEPGMMDGKPIKSILQIPLRF